MAKFAIALGDFKKYITNLPTIFFPGIILTIMRISMSHDIRELFSRKEAFLMTVVTELLLGR